MTCKGTLRQVFIKVYILEDINSQYCWYFRPSFVNCCPSNLLSGSTLDPLPRENKYTVYTYTVCKGGGYGGPGPQTDKLLPQSFFRWRHFALPSMSLIFLRLQCIPCITSNKTTAKKKLASSNIIFPVPGVILSASRGDWFIINWRKNNFKRSRQTVSLTKSKCWSLCHPQHCHNLTQVFPFLV